MEENLSYPCSSGMILPLTDESQWNHTTRVILYLIGLLYSFLGVAIAADVFMCAIERITSTTRKIPLTYDAERQPDNVSDAGSTEGFYREVHVWNPTVANLTLMALGSSAPEILLSIIEIVGNDFKAGELGPSTIVGSAAFNLLCITAVCIVSIPTGETRRIDAIWVFVVTAGFSIFAYIWMYFVLIVSSKGLIEIWEGAMTLAFFLAVVVMAYAADKRWCFGYVDTVIRRRRQVPGADGVKAEGDGDGTTTPLKTSDEILADLEDRVQKGLGPSEAGVRELARRIAQEYPHLTQEEQAKMVAWRLQELEPKDRLWYRIQATREWSSGKKKEAYWNATMRPPSMSVSGSRAGSMPTLGNVGAQQQERVLEFSSRVYVADPSDKRARLTVIRRGRNQKPVTFRYATLEGEAKKSQHFLSKSETMRFEPGEVEKSINIEFITGAEWKERETFFVQLSMEDPMNDAKVSIGRCKVAEVQFLTPTTYPTVHGCIVEFTQKHAAVDEGCGYARLYVRRSDGYNGTVIVHYETQEQTATSGADYIPRDDELVFTEGEVEKYIDITIIDDLEEEKDETFAVKLTKITDGSEIGKDNVAIVTILSDDETLRYFRQIDRLVPNLLQKLTPGAESWRDQIIKSTSVNAGDIDEATFGDCIAHVVTFPFKVIFALVPPPTIAGGWLTFVIALALIGAITAIVGDLASILGCLLGIPDAITAITFVALGTSLPDTFASRLAALNDKKADNAIGNVTGSNSVNVFLGLGLPWLIASIYWHSTYGGFPVPPGTLSFSVVVYTVCSVAAIALLFLRRFLGVFGKAELGGPVVAKWLSAAVFVLMWLVYVALSSIKAVAVQKETKAGGSG